MTLEYRLRRLPNDHNELVPLISGGKQLKTREPERLKVLLPTFSQAVTGVDRFFWPGLVCVNAAVHH